MKQAGLSEYAGGDDEARPDGEAAAVAGGDATGTGEVVDPSHASLPDARGTLEIAITQVDYTVAGWGEDERPIVHVFGRTADDELEHVQVTGFRPYFYVPTADLAEGDLADDRITGSEDGYESIRGTDLTRVYGRTPRDVGAIREEFRHYEADILFPNRFLIDKGLSGGMAVPERRTEDGHVVVHHDEVEPAAVAGRSRVHTLDIEVDDRSGFPEDGEEPIVCASTHDSYRDEYVAWLYEAPSGDGTIPADLDGHDLLAEGSDLEVRTYGSEDAMLDALVSYVEETDPDVLTGWNFEDFDAPYLLDRLDRLNPRSDFDLSVERLSRVGEVWRSDWGGPSIKGRVVFDLLYGYRQTQFSELDSYRLDAVGETELGVGKERYAGDIGDLWEDDPERLLEYNVRDVELCVELDRKQEVIAFWEEVAAFVGCKMEDATTAGDAVDMYVLHKAFGEFVLPSKGQQDGGEEFEGGAVFDPITGVRENVAVLDLASLYPMSMVTINASPETKVDPEIYEGDTYRSPNGIHFRKEPDGMIRAMVDELLSERENKKRLRDQYDPGEESYELYDRQQAAVKVIMNALYGTLGWTRFRLYDKDMSAAVTSTGREVIRFTAELVDEMGYEVVYGDTDSVLLELGEAVTIEEAVEQALGIEEDINERYAEFASTLNVDVDEGEGHRFEIEFEKLYRRFFQAGKKKRYAGLKVWVR